MMKKKTMAATVIIALGVVIAGFPVSAGQNLISQGNIVFEDGEMALYASDIDYLQNEIDNLFDEIPDEDKGPSDSTIDYVRGKNIQSKGIIDYAGGTVVINSSDLYYMANEIDILENTYKQIILKYLNGINTYMTADGSITHDAKDSDVTYYPTFEDLINGISLSQEVATETTIDNLSKDKGAWVNGEYITGNGNDVNAAYSQGYIDGVNTAQNAKISYVYHEHKGNDGNIIDTVYTLDNPGGCYVSAGHTHDVLTTCPTHLQTVETFVYEKCGCTHYGVFCGCGHSHGEEACNAQIKRKVTNTVTAYDCEFPINTWIIGCGKTPGITIESATITFDN